MNERDLHRIESVFRLVNREVWIVTAADGERRGGLVATWVSQASIDREAPTSAIALATNHFTRELVDGSGAFALHLISSEQIDLVWRFALGSGQDRDKLSGVDSTVGDTGSPILQNVLASLECRVIDRHDGGDRIYYWADVVGSSPPRSGSPLCEQELFEKASDEQTGALREAMLADVEIQRPLLASWRVRLDGRT